MNYCLVHLIANIGIELPIEWTEPREKAIKYVKENFLPIKLIDEDKNSMWGFAPLISAERCRFSIVYL
jgi:hypothetical protein